MKHTWIITVILLHLTAFFKLSWTQISDVTVTTQYGSIKGLILRENNAQYNRFLGIPYASPPQRFQAAQPPTNWTGTLEAIDNTLPCPNLKYIDDPRFAEEGDANPEDCLKLDIWVPGDINDVLLSPLAVMVLLHGGLFAQGDLQNYPGSVLVTQAQPVIYVAVQHRDGILGYATTSGEEDGDDDVIEGMLGHKDQVQALRWIRDNIADFGGDRRRVTLFGSRSGAQSVLLHMVSPMSQDLFHRAVAHSPIATWRLPRPSDFAGYMHRRAFERFNCSRIDLLPCLQNAHWTDIVTTFNESIHVIDGAFLPNDPWRLYQNGRINNAELIVGFTHDDQSAIFQDLFHEAVQEVQTDADLGLFIDLVLMFCLRVTLSEFNDLYAVPLQEYLEGNITQNGEPLENVDELLNTLRDLYTPSTNYDQIISGLENAIRDAVFVSFSLFTAQQTTAHDGNARMFYFEHLPQVRTQGAADILFVLGEPLREGVTGYSEADRQLSQSVMRAWTTFAADGTPFFMAADGSDVIWPQYGAPTHRFLRLDNEATALDSTVALGDASSSWQRVADAWSELRASAQFGPEPEQEEENSEQQHDDESNENFKTDILKMDKFEADMAVILLCVIVFLLLIGYLTLCCMRCQRKGEKYVT